MNDWNNLQKEPAGPPPLAPKISVEDLVFLGLRGKVAALNKSNGQNVWSTPVRTGGLGASFVTVTCDGDSVYAYGNGWMHRLNALTGGVLWSNGLEGYGYGFGSICLRGSVPAPDSAVIAALAAQEQAAHSAAAH